MSDNKVSIIMPVYNAERYLDKSIKSVLNQTYNNFELIIIDDGSIDKSVQICEKYLCDNRVKLITQKNSGPSCARNQGLMALTGDFLMFLDADDFLNEEALISLVEVINKKKADLCVYAWKEFQDSKKTHYFSEKEMSESYEEIFADIIYFPYLCGGGYPWNKIWRINAIRRYNKLVKFDEELYLYEDKLWTIQNLNRINKIIFYNKCIYNYRVQNCSLSHNDNNQLDKLYHSYKAARKIREYICENHYSLYKYADNLEWSFKLNYLFAVRVQKKTGKISDDFGELYYDFRKEKYRNLSFKLNIKYIVLRFVQWIDDWRERWKLKNQR